MKINVGILISYDYAYAYKCIERIYKSADRIVLAIDKDYRMWTGKTYEIDPLFFDNIKANDTDNKIEVLRGDFYDPTLTTMESETRARNIIAQHIGLDSGWHVQIDVDEYFVDFDAFVAYLHSIEGKVKGQKVSVFAEWITMFKSDDGGCYIVDSPKGHYFNVATNYPLYWAARVNPFELYNQIHTRFAVIHQSWARPDAEIERKMGNWGHSADFDTTAYLEFWRGVDRYSAPYLKNFHPVPKDATSWPSMVYVAGGVDELIERVSVSHSVEKMAVQNRNFLRKAMWRRQLWFKAARWIYHLIKR